MRALRPVFQSPRQPPPDYLPVHLFLSHALSISCTHTDTHWHVYTLGLITYTRAHTQPLLWQGGSAGSAAAPLQTHPAHVLSLEPPREPPGPLSSAGRTKGAGRGHTVQPEKGRSELRGQALVPPWLSFPWLRVLVVQSPKEVAGIPREEPWSLLLSYNPWVQREMIRTLERR